ncbi:DUF393 domain-containing protein (plasmid) [Vibrio sp. SS-MA-C1-2]|uniref:thiol-disulfide oxidoreductase DCC family protein n=1 Tax=Vibrio sp. SS-MA-C1-2 TaxID=2908646 RepID=UPI001F3B8D59|nr:DUF393 domain-containing protein [Vibrio sp. SS-MA-C1-2]UJF20301.1 DUF393 domain-containing protein [Vibrio sp. SS-MA-C1-2]
MITVFYDGKCGLCSREINHYREIAPIGIFKWQDVTVSNRELEKEGITLSEGLKIIHAKDAKGRLYRGVDAFILIWKQLNRWSILANIISLPVIRQCVDIAYIYFANWRFNRLSHCQMASKEDNKKS